MPTLYLFVGYPGSGKTTVANYICQSSGSAHIWADQERHQMFEAPSHSAEESKQLYDHLNTETAGYLEKGQSVVFDTNFNFRKDRDYLRQIAEHAGADVKLIWMITDKQTAKKRALHNDHAERNGYMSSMTEKTFERIAAHLEPPTEDENAIQLVGKDLEKGVVLEAVGLS